MGKSAEGDRVVAGLALVVVGLTIHALQRSGTLGEGLIVLTIGALLMAGYVYRPGDLMLVPSCVLLGLAASILARPQLAPYGSPRLIGLGAGFVAIWTLGRYRERKHRVWPLIAGSILLFVGIRDSQRLVEQARERWPLMLVAIGLLLVLAGLIGSGSRSGNGAK